MESLELIVGIKFKKEGKVYSFGCTDASIVKNDLVIVDTDNGIVIGMVATDVSPRLPQAAPANLKQVVRKATDEDLRIREENQRLEGGARQFCQERIKIRGLPMKLIAVESLFDRSKLLFYFSAENRVDFRELVKDLVQRFKTRIELRQIGARQVARMVKGFGICGREVCCASLLRNLDRVSVKMAKEQNMSLNPDKISGICGRLMCCLSFEYDGYVAMRKDMPKCGKIIPTAEGPGKVVRQNVLAGEVSVELENGKEITIHMKDA
ncbi:MAG: stage 0 sporulation family protein [Deltaproteobacteria bacterium]|nr:stage 0 sporulation family protein [Deltaproteobacteria bacterium]